MILEVFGIAVTDSSIDKIITMKNHMNPGDKYKISVLRGDQKTTFKGELIERLDFHIFEVNPDATDKQIKL